MSAQKVRVPAGGKPFLLRNCRFQLGKKGWGLGILSAGATAGAGTCGFCAPRVRAQSIRATSTTCVLLKTRQEEPRKCTKTDRLRATRPQNSAETPVSGTEARRAVAGCVLIVWEALLSNDWPGAIKPRRGPDVGDHRAMQNSGSIPPAIRRQREDTPQTIRDTMPPP